MTIIETIILGIVQGATEFIPVSSSGHVFITYRLLDIDPESADINLVNMILHLGTFLAVLVYYRTKLISYVVSFFRVILNSKKAKSIDTFNTKIIFLLAVSTVPVGVVGLLFDEYVQDVYLEDSLRPLIFTSAALTILGIFYLFVPLFVSEKRINYKNISIKNALVIGFAQIFALFYGISRSGMTIVGGEFSGLKRKDAMEYAFLLSIPVIFGGIALEFLTTDFTREQFTEQADVLILGLLTSFIAGYVSIEFLLTFLKTQTFRVFGIYCITIGILALLIA